MKILLTNHQLINYGGTEVFTYTLAKSLRQKGHDVVVYSAYLGKIAETFRDIDVQVVDDLEKTDKDFDLAHVHHNINAFEVRNRFPNLPMVFMSHGALHYLEQPPFIDLGISKYLAISEEVQENLSSNGIQKNEIVVVRNLIDENKYFPCLPINPFPKHALVISNKIDLETEKVIRNACKALSITCNFIGARFKSIPNDEIPNLINQHDIVFSLGRGVVEAMLCGRVPIVLDYQGGDGMVTPNNVSKLITKNFSGRVHKKVFSENELVDEIINYKEEFGESLRNYAIKEFSVTNQTEKLLSIYSETVGKKVPALTESEKKIVLSICKTVKSTRKYSEAIAKSQIRNVLITELGGDRAFLFFRSLGRLRHLLLPQGSGRKK